MEKTFDLAQILSNLSQNTSFDKDDTSVIISGDYNVPESGIANILQYLAKGCGKELLAGAIKSGDGNWTGSFNIQLRNVGTLVEKIYPLVRDKHLIDRKEALEDKQYAESLQKLQSDLDDALSKVTKLTGDIIVLRESKANLEAELQHLNEILKENHDWEHGGSEK